MNLPDYVLDLDRSRPQTIREQAREAIAAAIRSGRPGFCVGDRLIAQELSRQNAIHRNTLATVMSDLVRMGFLLRLPNKGFEVVQLAPERPSLLTRHFLSLTEVAQRDQMASRSELIPTETGVRQVRDLPGDLVRVSRELALGVHDTVSVIARYRLVKRGAGWNKIAVEQAFISSVLAPGLFENATQQIQTEGDYSMYRQLRRNFPKDEFFKAYYEISLFPLPAALAAGWTGSTSSLISIVSITYCSQGPVEMTRTWFDANQATLVAGSLDVKLNA